MNWRRFLKMMVTDPNSPDGLIIRAEKLEEDYLKTNDESFFQYARVLRELASKNWPTSHNREWIRKNLRNTGGTEA